jgi:hypothetical protein
METADLYAGDGPSFILPALASSYLFLFYNIQLGLGLMKEGNESQLSSVNYSNLCFYFQSWMK